MQPDQRTMLPLDIRRIAQPQAPSVPARVDLFAFYPPQCHHAAMHACDPYIVTLIAFVHSRKFNDWGNGEGGVQLLRLYQL